MNSTPVPAREAPKKASFENDVRQVEAKDCSESSERAENLDHSGFEANLLSIPCIEYRSRRINLKMPHIAVGIWHSPRILALPSSSLRQISNHVGIFPLEFMECHRALQAGITPACAIPVIAWAGKAPTFPSTASLAQALESLGHSLVPILAVGASEAWLRNALRAATPPTSWAIRRRTP